MNSNQNSDLMKIRCLKSHPTGDENVAFGYECANCVGFELTVDKEYVVLGISFLSASTLNKGATFLLKDDYGRCAFVPIFLLEISDSIPSKYWRVKKGIDGDILIWPEEFFSDYFFDDLSDGGSCAIKIFRNICAEMEAEAT